MSEQEQRIIKVDESSENPAELAVKGAKLFESGNMQDGNELMRQAIYKGFNKAVPPLNVVKKEE